MPAEQLSENTLQKQDSFKGNILCVDDEAQILSSLKRLLRRAGHTIILANSGVEALEYLKENQVDLVISDMRMPEMDGNEFLSCVAKSWPKTVRILLTGYSDIDSTVGAINNGHIYRYIAKPWDDSDLLMSIQGALDVKHLRDESTRLNELTKSQNAQLVELNNCLEEKVRARTEELTKTADLLRASNNNIQQAYSDSIEVFSRLISMREEGASKHGERIAELSDLVSRELGYDEEFCQDLHYAALLHDIGKIGLPDDIFKIPYESLSEEQREMYQQHCANGQAILFSLGPLSNAANIIRSHHEHVGGGGFPDKLKNEEIPEGAKILCVVNEFDDLKSGALHGTVLNTVSAVQFLKSNIGRRYEKSVVEALLRVLEDVEIDQEINKELILSIDDVVPGMKLAEDVYLRENVLMLRCGQILTESFISKFKTIKKDANESNTLKILT